jgi:hypothetical protein
MCFLCISQQSAIISINSINRRGFITEMECAYWAVRTQNLNEIHISFVFLRGQYTRSNNGNLYLIHTTRLQKLVILCRPIKMTLPSSDYELSNSLLSFNELFMDTRNFLTYTARGEHFKHGHVLNTIWQNTGATHMLQIYALMKTV